MGTVGQYLGQKGPVINQHDVSDQYRERYADTFGKSPRERWLEDGGPDETFDEWRERTGSPRELPARTANARLNGVRGCMRAP
jgi:hypothetical protein